ncbi:N-acetylmuramoyl-L-alanine amidase family protein [Ornithinibacillus sp. 179-J 7C1 HS]|uniref:N-acetylmuramoyl-L-alanine amidase family protein n=1 Tax=Ornithinibacillus sp. 179-J 7C1 HS TaxID=3142384 RepID=UPI0039A2B37A
MNKWMKWIVGTLLVILLFFVLKDEDDSNEMIEEIGHITNHENIIEKAPGESYKVVIDAGHGGEDPGAIGASGSYEKDFTLQLAKKVQALLEQESELEVYMTRKEDVFLSAETRERPNFANSKQADLFVSIHGNTFEDPAVTGTETFYYHKNSKKLANTLHKHVVRETGFRDRGVKRENYFVLKDTTMPAVLLEVGYITNPHDEERMLSEDFQQSVAEAIRDGILEYLSK